MTHTRDLPDPRATDALGAELAAALPADASGWLLLLRGELGSGKSSLARALLQALGHTGPVPSPTYTLVEPYDLPAFTAYHIDLYRIAAEEELQFLGWGDLQDGLRVVEWPERIPALEAAADLAVTLSYRGDGRRAVLEGLSEQGRELVAAHFD